MRRVADAAATLAREEAARVAAAQVAGALDGQSAARMRATRGPVGSGRPDGGTGGA
jgi:hypothetical protein